MQSTNVSNTESSYGVKLEEIKDEPPKKSRKK